MPGGRPTKYNKKMLDKARDYLINHEDYGDVVPTAAGLACELNVSKKTVYVWGEEHPEFQHTLQSIQASQERKLTSGGLSSAYQPTIVKLMLANHGYHEKQDFQHSGKDGDPIQIEFINAKNPSD